MFPRAFLLAWLLSGVMCAAAEPAAAPAGKGFDLEARRRAQAWVWETPRPQAAPAVSDTAWPLDAVDRFILHGLEEKGLRPAAPVDDRTWLRRASFAVTGLPPTSDELHAFLADRGPDARGRAVDRMLASPHFGERWARHWMDLVRYAETRGHEGDYHIANAWQYRDYLVRAFNAGVPYDRFLSEHLAGDLLPEPRLRPGDGANESVLGTGWAFLGEENHSPVDIRQDECDRLDNKLDVFTKAFLGLTVSCARCHDHKFDAISTRDYYGLTGFLLGSSYRQVRFEAMENNRMMASELAALRRRSLPRLAAATGAARREGLRDVRRTLVAAAGIAALPEERRAAAVTAAAKDGPDGVRLRAWADRIVAASTNAADALHGLASIVRGTPSLAGHDATNCLPSGAVLVADYTRAGVQPWKADGEAFGTGPLLPGDLLPGTTPETALGGVAAYGAARRDRFWNRLAAAPGNENDAGRLAGTARAGQMLRTPTFTLSAGRLHYLIRGRTRVYAAVDSYLMLEGPLHGQLVQVFDTGAADGPRWVTHDLTAYTGHRTHVEFGPEGPGDLEVLMVVESPEVPRWRPESAAFPAGASARDVGAFASAFEAAALRACDWLEHPDPSTAASVAPMADWLVRNPALFGGGVPAGGPEHLRAEADIAARVRWESHTAPGWFDGTGVDENVLVRGKPFKPGALAPRALPAAFRGAGPVRDAAGSGRRELAAQLVDPANPLVARVVVNRVWHHLFGRGIVPTVDNFGVLGERPTHPELLDHLAWEFVHRDGWSVKRLVRRLVLTRTYAMGSQSSDPRADEVDAGNRLWHRVPVRRLEAEAIRDALLTVSGRLNPAVGGPPVPVHLTEFVVGRGRPDRSGPLDGDGRRSLYLAVRRNFLPTTMLAFDSPPPFTTVGRRNVTNVPAQSLALMNDPLFHEQARVWSERMLRETPGADAAARVAWLFEAAYGRLPGDAERASCLDTLSELARLHGEASPGGASWTDLCHALLNANEFIYLP